MSGPKTSEYTLTREARERLVQQLIKEAEQRRHTELLKLIGDELSRCKEMVKYLEQELNELETIIDNNQFDKSEFDSCKAELRRITSYIQSFTLGESDSNDALELKESELSDTFGNARELEVRINKHNEKCGRKIRGNNIASVFEKARSAAKEATEKHTKDLVDEHVLAEREKAYIHESINDAMKELGYNVIGDRSFTRADGRVFKNELYKVGDGTVVNVSFSDNETITMELGAADSKDRLPTYREAECLVEDMEVFCSKYTDLERILLNKGVCSKLVRHMPATAEFAQVINVSEYSIKDTTDMYETKKRKRPVSSQKRMRKGG